MACTAKSMDIVDVYYTRAWEKISCLGIITKSLREIARSTCKNSFNFFEKSAAMKLVLFFLSLSLLQIAKAYRRLWSAEKKNYPFTALRNFFFSIFHFKLADDWVYCTRVFLSLYWWGYTVLWLFSRNYLILNYICNRLG